MSTKPPPTQLRRIGQSIKTARLSKDISQTRLVQAMGLPKQLGAYISRLEAGDQEPRITNLIKIADVLECSLDTLVGRERP